MNIRNVLPIPVVLPARGALIINFCFAVPHETLKGAEFGPFTVRIKYADGPADEIEHHIVMDITDAEHLEKKRQTGVPI
jgi:hypothetical protein